MIFQPTFEVEVAKPKIFNPESVVVPNPEFETLSHGRVVEPTHKEKLSPATEFTASLAAGDVVPTPTLPSKVKVVVAVAPNSPKLAENKVEVD